MDLRQLLKTLRNRWRFVAAVFAVASLTPVAFAQEKKGEATATEKKDGKADKKKSDKKDEKATTGK